MATGGALLLLVKVLVCFFFFCCCCSTVTVSQVVIPASEDGFVYKGALPKSDSVVVDAFFDPLCPDSRDSWPPLKRIIEEYAPRISLIVHTFPLPYHDNAFVASRALHIVDKLNSSLTYHLLEMFFKHQENYYGKPTQKWSRKYITEHIIEFTAKMIGNASLPTIQLGFEDDATNMATRTSFKYGCSRAVTGTPYFFVNGFPLFGGGSPLNYNTWKTIVYPLMKKK